MSDDDFNVYQGDDGKWRGKRQSASRASVVADTRELAMQSGSEVSIHRGDNGKIRDKHSYGNDPKSTEG